MSEESPAPQLSPKPEPKLRLFVAVAVPDQVKDRLETAAEGLKRVLAKSRVSWTRREQLHLTLKFLGYVEPDKVPPLIAALDEVCRAVPPLRVTAEQLGCFPNARRPRVLWAGLRDAQELLPQVQKKVQSALQPFTAEPPEDRFVGHVTLARVKEVYRPELQKFADELSAASSLCFGDWTVQTIALMRSELSAKGARYTSLHEAGLRAEY